MHNANGHCCHTYLLTINKSTLFYLLAINKSAYFYLLPINKSAYFYLLTINKSSTNFFYEIQNKPIILAIGNLRPKQLYLGLRTWDQNNYTCNWEFENKQIKLAIENLRPKPIKPCCQRQGLCPLPFEGWELVRGWASHRPQPPNGRSSSVGSWHWHKEKPWKQTNATEIRPNDRPDGHKGRPCKWITEAKRWAMREFMVHPTNRVILSLCKLKSLNLK